MASVGPNSPSSVVNNSGVGTQAWTNPSYAQAEDGSNATSAGSDVSDIYTYYLWATQFGFTIPTSAIVQGVVASVKRRKVSGSGNGRDNIVKLIKTGAVAGDNKADTATDWPATLTWKDYGSSTDPWNAGLSAADVNASNSGLALSARIIMNALPGIIGVDDMHLTIYYIVPSRGPGAVLGSMQPMIFCQRRTPKLVMKSFRLPFRVRRF